MTEKHPPRGSHSTTQPHDPATPRRLYQKPQATPFLTASRTQGNKDYFPVEFAGTQGAS